MEPKAAPGAPVEYISVAQTETADIHHRTIHAVPPLPYRSPLFPVLGVPHIARSNREDRLVGASKVRVPTTAIIDEPSRRRP